MTRLEHVNITVSDPQRSATMMEAIFGWKTRWQGSSIHGGFTIHVGSDIDYIAFYKPPNGLEKGPDSYFQIKGLNHVALVVDDLDAIEAAVLKYGFQTSNQADYEPGRRFYFHDHDDVEYEVVSYA